MKRFLNIRHFIALFAVLALLLGTTAVVYAETGSSQVDGGALAVSPANITFGTATLTGADLTATSTSNAWTAKDPTGTGAGWHLTITSGDFTTDTVQEVDVGSSTAGTFTLTYSGQTTASIAYNATDATVKSSLEALSNVTDVVVFGTGSTSTPWVVRFVTTAGSGIMTSTDTLTGGSSTVKLKTVDVSVSDQQLTISLADNTIAEVSGGNTKPTSSVVSATDIADSTVTFLSAATGEGMGDYTLDPNFILEIRAETFKGTYTTTITVAIVSAP